MLKHKNIRSELRGYLGGTVARYEKLVNRNLNEVNYKREWSNQQFAIEFFLEDMNVLKSGPPCIDIFLYDEDELELVQNVAQEMLEFDRIGKSEGYGVAFQSAIWVGCYEAAKVALGLILRNDANPPS